MTRKTPELILPTLKAFQSANAGQQIMMWRRAKAWLSPEKRTEANKNGTHKPNYAKTVLFLQLIQAHWSERRNDALQHPNYFDWPETQVWIGAGSLNAQGWLKDGVLSVFGYSVGQEENLRDRQRKDVLEQIFALNIPPVFGWDQLNQWGDPQTPARLLKMANCLASFSRNAKHRKDNHMRFAVGKWESDLAYLKSKFYDGKFQFGFPAF